ncbi:MULTISPECIES: DUF2806 domain-containing protein [Sorangium]|uniref:DUF2806 domain-containing protein n=1 Tax=Sorangium TaxID=39643 RepID=UPI003D9C472A
MSTKETEATSSNELMKIEAGVSTDGANAALSVSREFPGVLARCFPKMVVKARATQLISGRILEKISKNEPLDAADAEYARDVLGEAEAKWIRRQEIAARAARVLETEHPVAALPAATRNSKTSEATTSDDWLNRFWEDAALVSDEMLQEIYARVLASEAVRAGSCSTRTLRALRYLDRETADAFARLASLVFDDHWVPRDIDLLRRFGVSYASLLELDDAGLIDSGMSTNLTFTAGSKTLFRWHSHVIAVDSSKMLVPANTATSKFSIDCFVLRSAGRDLMRLAQVTRDTRYLTETGLWLLRNKRFLRVAWAEMPSPSWEDEASELVWHPISSEAAKEGARDTGTPG